MKKILLIISFAFVVLINQNSVSALQHDYTNGKVKYDYNEKTKELFAYGYNNRGNLGTGNRKNVTEENSVLLNSKIDNNKIVDFVFTDSKTFLLSDAGKVYASGFNIGDGNDTKVRLTFRKLNFYNEENIKITGFKVNYFNDKDSALSEEINTALNMTFLTDKKNVTYELNEKRAMYTDVDRFGNWRLTYLFHEYRYANYSANLLYREKYDKNKFYELIFDKDAKPVFSFNVNKDKANIVKKYYSDGVIKKSVDMDENSTKIMSYHSGTLVKKEVTFFKNYKYQGNDMIPRYNRYKTKKVDYYYVDGKLFTKDVYKYKGKKKALFLTITYIRDNKSTLQNDNLMVKKIVEYHKGNDKNHIINYFYDDKGKIYKKHDNYAIYCG